MSDIRSFFSQEDETQILAAIQEAESNTSGEIRLHVTGSVGEDPMADARKAFEALGMRNTDLHNGVLFFLAVKERKFVILGDDGINEKVPDDFWEKVKDSVIACFREGRFAEGLAAGIKLAGEQLSTYFPHQRDDVNELPDAISYADEEEEA